MLMKKFLLFLSFIISYVVFYNFEYEINEFNAKTRSLIIQGKFSVREFDEKGIPHSYNARQGKFISPYYVAHYGLNYSDSIKEKVDNKIQNILWWDDPTAEYWNVKAPKQLINENSFRHSLEWIVENTVEINGVSHLPYTFEWEYKNLSINKLKPIWWSGLTDSLAMNLLLRGYFYYEDPRYLKLAQKFYHSLVTDIKLGGSLDLDKMFIIEYASEEIPDGQYAYVLNGAYYAYKNIKAYEELFNIEKPFHDYLYWALINNLSDYFNGGWSYYDSIGSVANIKYNNINYTLAKDLLSLCDSKKCELSKALITDRTILPFFMKSILLGSFEVLVFHLLIIFLLCNALLYLFMLYIFRLVKIKYFKS